MIVMLMFVICYVLEKDLSIRQDVENSRIVSRWRGRGDDIVVIVIGLSIVVSHKE